MSDLRLKFETRGCALHVRLLPAADALTVRRETLSVVQDPSVGWVQLWSEGQGGESRLIWDSRQHDTWLLYRATM